MKLNNIWQAVVGLEIHAQLCSRTKLFSRSSSEFGHAVNTQVSSFDCAIPGTLPIINYECVVGAVKTSLALNCVVNKVSNFERKHYFYADLPAGYQITQQRNPIGSNGHLTYSSYYPKISKNVEQKTVYIHKVQLEQDSGKSLHDESANLSLIDLNRAGVALVEIVTDPNFASGSEAVVFVKELQLLLQTLGVCDGKMSEGSLRVDANISVNKKGDGLGTKTEVKNINSIKGIGNAIDFEIDRQYRILQNGGTIINETRSFNSETDTTESMRDKEVMQDYRFLPEPNLPPLVLYDNPAILPANSNMLRININDIRKQQPELPEDRRTRFTTGFGLPAYKACLLVSNIWLANYYEQIITRTRLADSSTIYNLLFNDYLSVLYELNLEQSELPINDFALICDMVSENSISRSVVKTIIKAMICNPGHTLSQILEITNVTTVVDRYVVEQVCEDVLNKHVNLVNKYKQGNSKCINYLIGQARKDLPSNTNPKTIIDVLKGLLN